MNFRHCCSEQKEMDSLLPANTKEEPWNYDWGSNKANQGKHSAVFSALGFLQTREKKIISSSKDFPKNPLKDWLMNKVLVKVHL